jgi:hypothetical protein
MNEADRLRKLAAWYRAFAERAGEPWIWEARLQTADELENAAALLEQGLTKSKGIETCLAHRCRLAYADAMRWQ